MSIEKLKQLRAETGIPMMDCKNALEEAKGDIEKAKKILREKGKEMLKDRKGKTASAGVVSSYIHANGKIGVLLQLLCESDFVAQSEEFKKLAHELCLQIAASKPLFVRKEDISEEFLDGERKIYEKQIEGSGKPKEITEKIIQGKIEKYKKEVSLLSQEWVKDTTKTVQDLIDDYRAKIGEKIEVGEFVRYEI